MKEKEKRLNSYHTFFFPFLWDDNASVTRKQFCKALPKEWKPDTVVQVDREYAREMAPLSREGYAVYQYFNEAARRALFQSSEKDGIVECFYYAPLNHQGEYCITKEIGGKTKEYRLEINGVRLKVFNTGVAVMVFELEYRTALSPQDAREAVMMINEFGRRLYPPFLPLEERKLLCADKLAIYAPGLSIEDDFRKRIRSATGVVAACDYAKNPHLMPNIILSLLGERMSTEPKAKGKLHLEPAIDDRMFACCCVVDGVSVDYFLGYQINVPDDAEAQKAAAQRRQEGAWAFERDYELGRELYALLNIDARRSDCSCNSRRDLDRYLAEQLYTRWAECGTLYGITNHSLLCLTGTLDTVGEAVINPFLTLYTQICVLVVAQRASLIAFGKDISRIAACNMHSIWSDGRERLAALQQRFAAFQGEMLLPEVTPQIQGIEIYKKLQTMLFVPELEENNQAQMNNLFETVETIQGDTLNIGGILLAAAAMFMALYQGSEAIEPSYKTIGVSLFVTIVPVLLLLGVHAALRRARRHRRRRR